MLCIWSHLLAQLAGNRGHADNYGTTVGMGEPGISNFFFFSIFPNSRTYMIDWSFALHFRGSFFITKQTCLD